MSVDDANSNAVNEDPEGEAARAISTSTPVENVVATKRVWQRQFVRLEALQKANTS